MTEQARFYLKKIQKRVYEDIVSVLETIDKEFYAVTNTNPTLGEVKDFGSLAQRAPKKKVSLCGIALILTKKMKQKEPSFRLLKK